jgi:hypothetical protein
MIRIEVEVEERTPGKVETNCKAVEGCWSESTRAEKRFANDLVGLIQHDMRIVGEKLGECLVMGGAV